MFKLSKEELEIFNEILLKKVGVVLKDPKVDDDPYKELLTKLGYLGISMSFKQMISIIPELIAYSIRYGMHVERCYWEDKVEDLEADKQDPEKEPFKDEKSALEKIKEDLDKSMYYV